MFPKLRVKRLRPEIEPMPAFDPKRKYLCRRLLKEAPPNGNVWNARPAWLPPAW